MSDETSTTAAKASGVTPTTALPDTGSDDQTASAKKSNLPASNPDPLPESPAYVASDSVYPPPAEPGARPAAPTATINNLTEMPPPAGTLASLDDDTVPTATTSTTVNLTDPPAPQPGAIPTPTSSSTSQPRKENPSAPRPGATPSVPAETVAAAAVTTSMPAPSFTMPPQQAMSQPYGGQPELTQRMPYIHPPTKSTMYDAPYSTGNYPSAIRRGSEVAPMPGGYRQRDNLDSRISGEEPPREEGILGKVSKAVDQFNEWMVGADK
ncbi:hypothetical protein H072_10411 [Dactylellina haptotyla CBS 200.50]|uniref:Uncharacterized protein n=1 Tax=Dactylellina haptotyla (strain CBS 200.50) TaxID=1284197 RepID=S8BAC7_DACHA|nr:hypothetical protein H072_10411 [Dactylellina haptotyla CBS 200.50]